jgi:hypothetical protein
MKPDTTANNADNSTFNRGWMRNHTGSRTLRPGDNMTLGRTCLYPDSVPPGLSRRKLAAYEPSATELDLVGYLQATPATDGVGYSALHVPGLDVKADGGALRLLALLTKVDGDWHVDLQVVNGDPEALHATLPRQHVGAFGHAET